LSFSAGTVSNFGLTGTAEDEVLFLRGGVSSGAWRFWLRLKCNPEWKASVGSNLEIGEIGGAGIRGSFNILAIFDAIKVGSSGYLAIFFIGVSGTVCSSCKENGFAVVFGGYFRPLLGGRSTVSFATAITTLEFALAAFVGAGKG